LAFALTAVPVYGQGASGAIEVVGPAGDPLREATPRFSIRLSGFVLNEFPLSLRLQLSTRADFTANLADTTIVVSATTSLTIPRLMPEGVQVWWRVLGRTALGAAVNSDVTGPRTTPHWLTLSYPNNANGSTLDTRRPTFLWSSPIVYPPVAPWTYLIVIRRSSDGSPEIASTLNDTVYTAIRELESNTSYRWSVSATTKTGDSTRVQAAGSFVILDPNAPVATVLYQSFPSPFPNTITAATCIWFDLRVQSDVQLDVLDLRGSVVNRLLPGRGLGSTLPAGRYGRAVVGGSSGCDDRLAWDGRDLAGRTVPPGVYLIRFQGDGKRFTRSVVWKGR
jgi:hypothetical protein